MYKIKQIPEDFIVKEISNVEFKGAGNYSYFLLKKTNYTTVRAIEHIAKALRIKPKNIGFAGNKDKNAITEQVISFFNINNDKINNLRLKDIELKSLGKGNEPVSLGDLEGNYFEIDVRNLDGNDIDNFNEKINSKIIIDKEINDETNDDKTIKNKENDENKIIKTSEKIIIPNYFGEQRFSKNNPLVGKAIIKDDFKEAVELILENKGDFEEKIKVYLKENKNDCVGAVNLIPFKIRKLYVHAYQSYLFNKTIDSYLELFNNNSIKNGKIIANKEIENKKIPLIGFGTETEDKEVDNLINTLLEQENVNLRDFIIRKIPDLSSEGGLRDLFFEINDLKVIGINDDSLNKNKKKIKLGFSLKKGCYATVAIKYLFSQDIQDLP